MKRISVRTNEWLASRSAADAKWSRSAIEPDPNPDDEHQPLQRSGRCAKREPKIRDLQDEPAVEADPDGEDRQGDGKNVERNRNASPIHFDEESGECELSCAVLSIGHPGRRRVHSLPQCALCLFLRPPLFI